MQLKAHELDMVQSILADVISAYEVRAFGSRVHGNRLKPFSDIDLAVISPRPLPWHVLGTLKERFDESGLPYKVDIVDYVAASPKFRAIIDQAYEVIHQPKVEACD
ncbi:MAG: nucleotidyltransferase domain-containing protein [Ghiorsea sp.]|nr:nucleotidyltransferase domain-containing protein [Ghiorsea sp.]